ncbi:MAG: type IVB secretion system protein IcmQ [Gammaproteobacteria bacterium]
MPDQNDREQKVLELVREAVKFDEELRNAHQIGNKFRFVRDRLNGLLEGLEKNSQVKEVILQKSKKEIKADEVLVYVYLYNANGLNLVSWQNMLAPKVFYEYSVNRPIYLEKPYIDALLRSKTNKVQHGYLTVTVKKDAILQSGENAMKDSIGNTVVKVKEGSLNFDNLISFTHNGHDYTVDSEGKISKKD